MPLLRLKPRPAISLWIPHRRLRPREGIDVLLHRRAEPRTLSNEPVRRTKLKLMLFRIRMTCHSLKVGTTSVRGLQRLMPMMMLRLLDSDVRIGMATATLRGLPYALSHKPGLHVGTIPGPRHLHRHLAKARRDVKCRLHPVLSSSGSSRKKK